MASIVSFGAVTAAAGSFVPVVPTLSQALYPSLSSLQLTALPGNAGPVYITTQSSGTLNTTTFAGVVAILPTSGSYSLLTASDGAQNDIPTSQLYISPSTSGYGILSVGKVS